MKRRRLIALVSVCSLLALGLAAAAAVLVVMRTDLARQFVESRLANAVNGTVHVGRISGNPFSGVTIDTLAIRDRTGELFLSTGRVATDYDFRDLWDARLFLRHLIVDHPYLHFRQYANGDWNFRRIFKQSPSTGAKPARALTRSWGDYIALDSVRALDGSFVLSLSWTPDDTLRGAVRDSVIKHELTRIDHNIVKTADGFARNYVWTHGRLMLPHVRLVDPDSNKFGRAIQIASLDADESDPPFRFRNVRGTLKLLDDSAWLDLSHWDLPASTGAAKGKIVWGGPQPIRYDIAVRGDSVALNDVNWVYPTLPKTGGGRLLLTISNKRDVHMMDYKLGQMDMRSAGSHLTGEMTFGVGAPILQLRNVDLIASPLDFEFIHTLNGKPLPVDWRGQIYGSVRASGGPLTDFEVDAAHGEWHDTHVPGAVSRLSGSGGLDILSPLFTTFHDFHVDVGSLDLRSIEYLFPAFPTLGGTISGQAALDSIWTDVRFHDADILHRDGPGKPSRLLGGGRITDGRRFITYDVALVADSLSFETLARSPVFSSLALRGMAAGPITIRGQTPDLQITTRLSGPAGQLAFNGTVDLDSVSGYSARGRGEFSRVNLAQLLTSPNAPLSSLNGRYDLDVRGSSARTLSGLAALKVDRSKFDSAVVDSANATVRFTNGRAILTDTLHVNGSMGRLVAAGSIGLPGGETVDSIHVTVDVDSLGSLRPYLKSAQGSGRPDSLAGKLRVMGVAVGNLDSLLVTGTIAGDNLYVRGIDVPRLSGTFSILDPLRAPHGSIRTTASALAVGGLMFDTVSAIVNITDTTHGSYTIAGAGRGSLALDVGGAWSANRGSTAVRLDSLAFAMANSRWALEMPTTLTVESSLFRIDSMTIRNGHGGSIQLAGVVPDSAPVDLRLMATNVPLADLTRLITPLPKPIAGLADVNARFGGTQQDLRVDASAILDSIMIGDVRVGRLMSTAHYQNQRATVGVNISQNAKQVLEASADSVPVSVTLFGYDTLPGRLHATLTADSADFALIQALIPGVSDVKGKMSGQFALDGSWNRPLLAGQFALSDASLRIDTLGIALDGLSGRATYARDTLFIDSTSALRAKSGDSKSSIATLFGRIAFQKWTPSWFDLSLRMKDFEAYNRSELARVVATTDSGPVRLFGTTKADSLTGYVVVSRSNMFLPDRKLAAKQIREPLSLPVDSATNRYGRSADTSATLFQRVTQNLYTSLRVHLGTDVSLSADYAEIPLTGDLNITLATVYSTTAARGAGAYISRLAPEGTIFADRGTYILDFVVVKRDLTVEKGGTITFDRAADWNPYLNLTTRYNVKSSGHPDIPVIVDVQGRLLPNPQLSFRTDAPFPISESDLVSYLLTGQPGFDLAGQTVEYRSLIASVLAPTVSSALSSTLRNRLGTGFDLSVQGAPADFTGKTGSAALTQSLTQFLYSTRINGEMQVSDKLFVSVSAGFCQLNNSYRQSLTQGSVLNQLSDPFGGNLEYRLSSTLRTGSNLQFAIEPSTQALLCSPSNELSLRGAAPTPRQYSLSFLKFWRW